MGHADRPTRARYIAMAYLCSLAVVLYLDRNCIGKATNAMQADLRISNTRWGFVLGSFTVAYGLFAAQLRRGDGQL